MREKGKNEMEGEKERRGRERMREESEDTKKVRDRNTVIISEVETPNTREQSTVSKHQTEMAPKIMLFSGKSLVPYLSIYRSILETWKVRPARI